jgi:hypothetical protein
MRGAYETPTEPCPYCKTPCDADWVDVGVGMVQCGPYHCLQCHASEIGPHDEPRALTKREEDTGWYAPESDPGSSANVIGGQHVSHRVMKAIYQAEFKDNPLWHDRAHVDDWWANVRKPK